MKNKSCHLIQQSHYWAYIWEKKKKTIWKDTCTLNVHCNTIYNNQVMEATSTSINRGVDKEDVVHVYTMEYYPTIKKKKMMPFAWVDLEIVQLSKPDRKRQMWRYCLYMESKKILYTWTYLQNRNRLTDFASKLLFPKGKCGEEYKLGSWA